MDVAMNCKALNYSFFRREAFDCLVLTACAWLVALLIFPAICFAQSGWQREEPVESLRTTQEYRTFLEESDAVSRGEVVTWKEFGAGIRTIRAELSDMVTKEELNASLTDIIAKLDDITKKVELNMKIASVFSEELDVKIAEVLEKQAHLVTEDELNEKIEGIVTKIDGAARREELNVRVAEILANQNNMVTEGELNSKIEKVVAQMDGGPKNREWIMHRGGILSSEHSLATDEKVNVGIKEVLAKAKQRMKDEKKIDAMVREEINANEDMMGDVYYGLALVYTRQKQYQKAINAYEQVIQNTSAYPDAYYHLGLLYEYQENNSEKALYYFRECLMLNISPQMREKIETLIGFME